MATHEYNRSCSGETIPNGGDRNYTIEAFAVPAGQVIYQFRVEKVTVVSGIDLRPISGQSSAPHWNQEFTNAALIDWTNGSTSKLKCHNSSGSAVSFKPRIVFITKDAPYTAVSSGNKIKATDRSQTGTSTTTGNVMTDSHFTAGTSATASQFNSKVLGL